MTYRDLLFKYAEAMCKASALWPVANDLDFHPGLALVDEYRTVSAECERLKLELALHPQSKAHSVSFSGVDHDVCHYEIDAALRERFEGFVSCDSEAGCFFAYARHDFADVVEKFLRDNFPGLDFERVDNLSKLQAGDTDCLHSVVIPEASNWEKARKHLKREVESMGGAR